MCFRKLVLLFVVSIGWIAAHAQCLVATSGTDTIVRYAYQVSFKDKAGSPPLSDSTSFLSPRAFARRAAQGLSVDSTDVPVSPLYLDSAITITGGKLHLTSKWLNLCVVLVKDTSKLQLLRSKPFITDVKIVASYTSADNLPKKSPPKISQLAKTTNDQPYYGNAWTQTQMVNGNYLHDNGYDGQGKLIVVLDAGFIGADADVEFDSLHSAGGYVDLHNFTLDTSYVYSYDTHGLNTLSTMAAYMPGNNGYVGSAPKAQYALYVTEDNNSEMPIELDNMVAGIERADSIGADVLSVSLGYDTFDCTNEDFVFSTDLDGKSTVTARAVNLATKKGMLFVASAGNDGEGFPGWSGGNILTPGEADSALTVGAVNTAGVCPGFSGHGPNAAGQVKPDVCLLGVAAAIFNPGGVIAYEDGTSFSTPQLAGWAACLWQAAGSGTTPYMIRRAIDQSANHYASAGTQIGYGVPNFQMAFQLLGIKDTPQLPASSPLWVVTEGNPFTNDIGLAVKVPTNEDVEFVLTDINGKTILTSTRTFYTGWNPRITLQLAALPAGMYILHAISPTQQQVLKLVKE